MWERKIDRLSFVCTLTGDWTHNIIGVPDDAPTNWATQPGLIVLLICISSMFNHVECLFIGSCDICVSYLVKCLNLWPILKLSRQEFFVYSKAFTNYVIGKFCFPVCDLSFYSLSSAAPSAHPPPLVTTNCFLYLWVPFLFFRFHTRRNEILQYLSVTFQMTGLVHLE